MSENKLVSNISELYGLNPNLLKEISNGFQNKVFDYSDTEQSLIIRVTENNRRSRDEIKAEIRFINYLAANGMEVAKAKTINDLPKVQQVHNGEKFCNVTVFEKAPGNFIDVSNPLEWNHAFFQQLGKMLGRMHALTKKYSFDNNRSSFQDLKPDILNLRPVLPSETVREKYDKLLNKLKTFNKDEEHFGLIHNDFHQGNFFVKENTITIFDFDDCAYYWFANDIAVFFYHAYWQSKNFYKNAEQMLKEFMSKFFEGYREENLLPETIFKQIPVFLKIREIFLYTLFLKKWNPETMLDWQKATLVNLQESIENELPYSSLF